MEMTFVKKIELKDVKYSYIFNDNSNIYLVSKLSNTIDKFNGNLELTEHFEFKYEYIDICYNSVNNVFYGLKIEDSTKNTIIDIIDNTFQNLTSRKINLNTTPTGINYNVNDNTLALSIIDKVLIVSLKTFKPIKTIPMRNSTDFSNLDSVKTFEIWLKLNKLTYPTQYLSSTRLLDTTRFGNTIFLLERVKLQNDFTTVISNYNIDLKPPLVVENSLKSTKDNELKKTEPLAITFAEDLDEVGEILVTNPIDVSDSIDINTTKILSEVLVDTTDMLLDDSVSNMSSNLKKAKSIKSHHASNNYELVDFYELSLDDLNFDYLQFEDFDIESDINYGTSEDLNFTADLNNKCNDILTDIDLVDVNFSNIENNDSDCKNDNKHTHCDNDDFDESHCHKPPHKNDCNFDCGNKCENHNDDDRCKDKCDEILHSIANVELGIAHILHSEGIKIQKVVKCSDSVCDILEVNNSVIEVIEKVTKLEDALCCKLKALKDVYPKKDKHCNY